MSYVTLEVDIAHGKVVPKEPGMLSDNGSGLLTVLQAEPSAASPLEAFRTLQREVQLTAGQAEAWKAAMREARR